MADRAHSWTDWKIGEIEKELDRIYSRAEKELEEKAAKYFKRFEDLDTKKRALVDAKKMTEEEYRKWRTGKIMTGKHWTDMKEQTAYELLRVNETAAAYVNGQLPAVYARNYNQVANGINGQIKGYSFELVDASTVRRLATNDKTLLPYKYIDGVKDVRWNTQKVNSEVLQGVLQGDSIPNLAKRLRNVTEMNRASSIRNARTSCTSAENKGRMDMLHDAEDNGVKTQKGWLATNDSRTRDSHAELNGVFVDIDDEFDNGLEYPGDPNGDPAEVYNCRCTLVYKVVGFGAAKDAKNIHGEQIEFSEKLDSEKWNEPKAIINELTQEYDTKLQTVLPGAHQSAGNVQISGTVMHLSSSEPSIAIHEFAHTISMENQTKFGIYDESDFWKEIKQVQRRYRKEVGSDVTRWISTYEHASKGADEFMAEAFTQAKMEEIGIKLPNK